MNKVVQVENLSLSLNGREILKDINFEVLQGEIFTIVGGSGSGKTSITKCIVGLWKPTEGKVEVFGKDINTLSIKELDSLRKDIGYVFQGSALFDSLKVWENVGFYYLERTNMSQKEIRQLALEKLRLVGLDEDVLELYPSELSGGMKKRVGIARAIATDPKLIIYDEPTSGLDPITSRMIDDLILSLRDKMGTTSIVVSHDLISAFSISDRIMVLKDGRTVQIGSPQDILSSEIPFVKEFLRSGFTHRINL
ncbi:ABC transporter ATP-binding protein [Hydrogenobacter hydrogenophilus]|uniref:Phospholipid/cholesterol/gamma-HCH transport system ATP-binding protein n=1 Tax=Hydrogenobacter hydrogenophilus TaxID=35835 RepID=A0A285P019_9AQUI|nr:ATP-binding cassette domain-containing protein [Hydrogenobacter hydrogenophilus]SNZ14778.1 phospholipid/cholesterol/gamma-HCH transport system ATP-binding protein [Hydrogenobacter hydrogenophilus]